MEASIRLIILMVLVDIVLIAATVWMVMQVQNGSWTTSTPEEAIRRIMVVAGTMVGGLTPIFLLLWLGLRRKGL